MVWMALICVVRSNQVDTAMLRTVHSIQLAADVPTENPTAIPTTAPTRAPSAIPTRTPTIAPVSRSPTRAPSTPRTPTRLPTTSPTTRAPTLRPTTASPTPVTFAPTDPYKGNVQLSFYSQLFIKGVAVSVVDKATIKTLEDVMATTLKVSPSQCNYLDSTFTTVSALSTLEHDISISATSMQLSARMETKVIIDYSKRDQTFLSMRNMLTTAMASGALRTNFMNSRAKFNAIALNSALVTSIQVDSTYSIRDPEKVSSGDELSNGAIVGIAIGSAIGLAILIIIIYNFCFLRKKSAKIGVDYKSKDEFDFPTEDF